MVLAFERAKTEPVAGKQQDRAGDRRLGHGHLVEILQRTHLGAGHDALERGVVPFDARNELRDLVILRDGLRGDLLIFAVIAADKADLAQDLFGRATGKVKDAVFLANSRCKHGVSFVLICTREPTPRTLPAPRPLDQE